MLCVVCNKSEAVVHYAEIVSGEVKKLDLCDDCAEKKGVGMQLSFSIGDLLGGLPKQSPPRSKSLTCPKCSLSFEAFKKKGRLGCGECFQVFHNSILPMLEQIHRSTQHIGKVPKKLFNSLHIEKTIHQIEKEMKEAINKENFEKAAILRDKLKELNENHP